MLLSERIIFFHLVYKAGDFTFSFDFRGKKPPWPSVSKKVLSKMISLNNPLLSKMYYNAPHNARGCTHWSILDVDFNSVYVVINVMKSVVVCI